MTPGVPWDAPPAPPAESDGKEMTEEDVQWVIDSYRSACANAKKAGFDGVELHAANGYLVDQFASTNTNLAIDGRSRRVHPGGNPQQRPDRKPCSRLGWRGQLVDLP